MSIILNIYKKIILLFKKAVFEVNYRIYKNFLLNKNNLNIVKKFFTTHNDFRSIDQCKTVTNINKTECLFLKKYLHEQNEIGPYNKLIPCTKAQNLMQEQILQQFKNITNKSYILEIGPGQNPVFDFTNFKNWYGVDRNLRDDGLIHFSGRKWKNENDSSGNVLLGNWEKLSETIKKIGLIGKFDLVVASHSFEHVFSPIKCLKEAALCLKPDGILVLFVPNGFSDYEGIRLEMTHTLYLVPEMIEEFFQYSDSFRKPNIRDFRMNYDLMISAHKK